MAVENKVTIEAPISVLDKVERAAQEKAAVLAFPDERQGDLQYIRSILVSAGTNKNGAHFLPSEMMRAHNTIVHKAIDIEHDETKVIGHIYDCAFLYKDGESFDPMKLMAEFTETSRDPDEMDIDIAIAGVIHKMRFPEYADEISRGEWKVSMECFFKDFDIKVGNQIITRTEAVTLGYTPEDLIGGFVKIMAGQKALGKHFVARVLRGITFSGMGIVKNPANPHSIVLETAAHKELKERGDVVINLESIDNLRGHSIVVNTKKEEASAARKRGKTKYKIGSQVTVKPGAEHDEMTKGKTGTIEEIGTEGLGIKFDGMSEIHKWYTDDEVEASAEESSEVEKGAEMSDTLVEVVALTEGGTDASDGRMQVYVEIDEATGGIKRILSTGGKENALRYTGPGIGGPGSINYWPDSLCASFKKRVTKFNALDQSEAVVLHEHWCALFEEACPVIGASAKAPECLRNQRNSVTKDPVDTTITKTIREHLDNAPSNTNTTVLQSGSASVASMPAEHIAKMRDEAKALRDSLREYILSAEKKTSK